MAGTALHMEALRKTRILERKSEAMKKLQEKFAQTDYIDHMEESKQSGPMFSEMGHYAQNSRNDTDRIRHRRCRAQNEGTDKVMPLMHPPEYNFTVPMHELPPRKPHFKV